MTVATAAPRSAHAALLAGYIAGTVTDEVMDRFDTLLDDAAATADERHAFAWFFVDALRTGELADALPSSPDEVTGILAAARA